MGGHGGDGGFGGGIASAGDVTVERCTFEHNFSGKGGAGGAGTGGAGEPGGMTPGGSGGSGGGGTGGPGGTSGDGAGIYLLSGAPQLVITASTFLRNSTGLLGPLGGAGQGGSGGQGFGAGNGGFGGGGTGGAGGGGGDGAGIYWPASVQVTGSLFESNDAGPGGNGGAAHAGGGGSSGAVGNGGTGAVGTAGSGGAGGRGGALFAAATVAIVNSTLYGNVGGFGGTGGAGFGGQGGSGFGGSRPAGSSGGGLGGYGGPGGTGAVHTTSGTTLTVTSATLWGNSGGPRGLGGAGRGGSAGFGSPPGTVGSATAGGDGTDASTGGLLAGGTATLTASIVLASNLGSCAGLFTDGLHNIAGQGCPGTAVDPKLAKPADNGGPTRTMALEAGSSALDIVPSSGAGCPQTDQRGVTRPHGSACDAGAYERAAPDVATAAADPVTGVAATLRGSVTANGRTTTYRFEYGPTSSYGSTTGPQDGGNGVSAVAVSAAVGQLAPNTTYHYRLVASSADGDAASADATFTTLPPAITGTGATDQTAPVILRASMNPRTFRVNKRGAAEKLVSAAVAGTRFSVRVSRRHASCSRSRGRCPGGAPARSAPSRPGLSPRDAGARATSSSAASR